MNTHPSRYFAVLLGLLAASWPLTGQAETTNTWSEAGRATAGFRYNEDAQEYYGDVLFTLWKKPAESRLLLDVRGTALEDLEQELNVGLVLRQLVRDSSLIVGGNLFYDTRWTEHDNTFDQLGAGVEVLSRRVDARANYYYPLKDTELLTQSTASETSSQVESGRQINRTTTSTYHTYEEALEGFDAEVGCWMPFLERIAPTALFVGYYSFDSDYAEDLDGFKARMEVRVHPRVTLDAEWFEDDNLNRVDYFVGARINIPLDFGSGRGGKAANKDGGLPPLEARMNDMVNRDFRIRTITTGPVLAGQKVSETSSNVASSNEQNSSDDEDAQPVVPEAPSNCQLDENGDVVCN